MNTREITATLQTLFGELVDGPPGGAYMLNRGDVGLLASLEKLSAAEASTTHAGGAAIASHVEHLRYGLSLMNRWRPGTNPWIGADWTAAWRKTKVSEAEWKGLRAALGDEARRWLKVLGTPQDIDETELNIVVGTIAHVAYHVGAIRQIDRATRGPSADEDKRRASA